MKFVVYVGVTVLYRTVMTIRDLIDSSFTSLPSSFCFHETVSFTRHHEIISIESSESNRVVSDGDDNRSNSI